MRDLAMGLLAATAIAAGLPAIASAQDADTSQLLGMDERSLEAELERRYQAGLAASLDQSAIAASDTRYLWAIETKVQCGIALGFLKSSTRDETSIGKCQNAYALMSYVPAPPLAAPPPPPPQQSPAICDDDVVGIVFFDFDSAMLTSEAAETLDTIVTNAPICAWRSFSIEGHTDQAGSAAYNIGLSQERAEAVEQALASRGIAPGTMTTSALGESNPRVPLADGTRSPQNRRVEISVN